MLNFIQINMKKAFTAAIELNKKLCHLPDYIVLATETYNFKGKVRSLPRGSTVINHENPRAAIIASSGLNIIKMEQLCTRDCAVGLLLHKGEKILIASIYLDIKMDVIQPWLNGLMTFADAKKYALIIGMDSNSHSILYGNETNTRGESLEDFILKNCLTVENVGLRPTFSVVRSTGEINSIIDVTLSKGIKYSIDNWTVRSEYNGSDHNDITFCYDNPLVQGKEVDEKRCWNKAEWEVF